MHARMPVRPAHASAPHRRRFAGALATQATGDHQVSSTTPPPPAPPRSESRAPAARSGFCRVTVVAPDARIDVALPDDLPVADLRPEILRLSGLAPAPGAPVGHQLVRGDGAVLDSARTLAAQRVRDGELIALRPFADFLPPPVFDDVCDAVASAVRRDRTLWSDDLTRTSGLGAGCALLVLLALALWSAHPGHDMHGPPGLVAAVCAALLLAVAVTRARVYADRASARCLGLGALASAAVAGSGLLPPLGQQGVGRLQALTACTAVLLAAVVLVLATPYGDAPFVAAALAAAGGALLTYLGIVTDLPPAGTAAVTAPLAVGALGFLPALSVRFARLPVGHEAADPNEDDADDPEGDPPQHTVDADRIAARARRGHELLLGLTGGCALLAAGAAAVLVLGGAGAAPGPWAHLLALATGLALLLRTQLFRRAAQIAALLTAGLATLLLLGAGLAADLAAAPGTATVWLAAGLGAAAALAVTLALAVPARGLTPFWGRFLELAESLVLLTLLPLALAVLDLYRTVRAMPG
ncbi:type VII secretion integral membrane protein EccD [Streptomyces sp. NPDC060194]|uniref:type VII secretion integral membrane protein EccD n=1 Tax=Streptomyces sp. NPDC060194 TaxID=3347069 RepID=UPI003655C907